MRKHFDLKGIQILRMRDDGEILKLNGTFEKFKYNYSEPLGKCHQIFAKRNNPCFPWIK